MALDKTIDMVTCQEFKETADAIRKSGKARSIGFSTHNTDRRRSSRRRPRPGIIDAIMLQYRPWLDKDSPLNKALDVGWKKGIGLISMKQIAGPASATSPRSTSSRMSQRRCPLWQNGTDRIPGPVACDLDR